MPDVQATGFDAKPAAGSALVVGQIESVVGACSLTRPGGDPFQVKPGDPICRGDLLETTAGGKVGIRFIDGTAFNLSDSARAVVKEFGCDGAEPSALFDISRGTFAFIAGEMARHGGLRIETPFARIRGRAQSGGIGMLSLASLFFAALDNAQGATTPPGLEDGIINIRDSNDIINAPFGIIELTVGSQTIFIDTPFAEFVVRGTSVSQVPLSLAQLQQHIIESINVQNIAALGQGPTVGGPSGSGGLPPPGPPPFAQPINFELPPTPPTGGPAGGSNGSLPPVDIFIPPPPPPPPLNPGEIREIIHVTNSGAIDSTSGPLPVGGPYEPTLFVWSGGDLTEAQINLIKQQDTFTPNGSTYTYTIPDHVLDFVALNETLKITYTSTVDPTKSVIITIFGTNDIPTIDASTNPGPIAETAGDSPAQDIPQVSGTITITDPDITDTLTVTVTGNATASYNGGAVPVENSVNVAALIASGAISFDPLVSDGEQQTINWHYDPAAADLDWLRAGDTLTLTYVAQVNDGHGNVDSQNLVITITGTNDVPTIDAATNPVAIVESEGDSSAQNIPQVNGTISITDQDLGDTLTVTVTGNATALYNGGDVPDEDVSKITSLIDAGAISFDPLVSDGEQQTINWHYDPAAADLDWLGAGDTLTLTYVAQVNDGHGNVDSQNLVITITGTSDADPNDFDEQATGSEIISIGNEIHGTPLSDHIAGKNSDPGQSIYGGAGNDQILGTGEVDWIYGGSGNDDINGNGDGDWIFGGSGNDTINGTGGSDHIIGGYGADALTGAGDSDIFVFLSTNDSRPGSFDTITDFDGNSDFIDLTAITGATNVQEEVFTANTVDAHSISWFFDNVSNETIIYVNTTDTANHIDMEIHLTGTNIDLSGSDILHQT